jgi:adenylate cyclase
MRPENAVNQEAAATLETARLLSDGLHEPSVRLNRHNAANTDKTNRQSGWRGWLDTLGGYWRWLEYSVARRIILTNQVCVLGLVVASSHALHILTAGIEQHWPYELLAVAGIISMSFALIANANGQHLLAKAIVATQPALIVLAAAFIGSRDIGVQLYLYAFWTALFLIFSRKESGLLFWYTIIYLGVVLVVQFLFVEPSEFVDTMPRMLSETYTIAIFQTFAFIAIVLYLFHREVATAERRLMQQMHQIQNEQERSETLLHNMMPGPIASQLKDGYKAIADRHADVSILFADIVNFSGYTTTHSAEEVVSLLESIFFCFDGIVQENGLEKIKTIGDAYMLTGGILQSQPDHPLRIARAALSMRDAIIQLRKQGWPQLSIRIGIHHGFVIAGVLGVNRLSFDVWGPSVNIASRMESHGQADHIHISDAFYQQIKTQFDCESRGSIMLKGLGDMKTWFLLGEKKGKVT